MQAAANEAEAPLNKPVEEEKPKVVLKKVEKPPLTYA